MPDQAESPQTKVAVCAIGSELTNGRFVDTNSAWLAAALREMGLAPSLHLALPDDRAILLDQLGGLWAQGWSIVCCGGLGPTVDDLTREICAALLECELQGVPEALELLKAYRIKQGRPLPDLSEPQVQVPTRAMPILNNFGTATGIHYDDARQFLIALPGIPRELKGMWGEVVAPRLRERFSRGQEFYRELLTFGIYERTLNRELKDLLDVNGSGIEASILINDTIARLRWATTNAALHGEVERLEQAACERLGELVFHRTLKDGDSAKLAEHGADPLASHVVGLLKARGERASFAESCTGGMASELITSVAGSSSATDGSLVSYANSAKQELLGVPAELLEQHGAVSGVVAQAMAEGVRARMQSDWGIGITGIAGPAGATEDKPVGTVWFGMAGPYGVGAWQIVLNGDRHMVRWRSARMALNLIRLSILRESLPAPDLKLIY